MKVLAVGRNYAKHARELGNAVPESPIWFWKPDSAIIPDGEAIELPAGIGPVHHEVELAVRLGKPARRLDAAAALRCVDAITVANDLTARDLQEKAKKAGLPWAQAKGYDTFLPLGAFQEWDGRDLQQMELRLSIDGQVRQHGQTRDMVFGVGALLAHASSWTTLRPGDVLLTGTPDGVGPVAAGQRVRCELVGVATLENPVVAA
ncbi:MAG: acylpyruvate hydrolase [Thermoplasmata archaeon]|jgi:acylpyruvate hydrolase|nr:acylpyruvate hydrolase [Thermoplasmata archaeon]